MDRRDIFIQFNNEVKDLILRYAFIMKDYEIALSLTGNGIDIILDRLNFLIQLEQGDEGFGDRDYNIKKLEEVRDTFVLERLANALKLDE